MLKSKEKLNLINNYIEIYKCIFDCKQSILKEENNAEKLASLTQLFDELITLKKLYEEIFVKQKLMDTSLILLKQELEETLQQSTLSTRKNASIENIILTKNRLKETINRLN